MIFDDHSVDIGDLVIGSLYVSGSGPIMQRYIDQGFVGQGWHELDHTDGKVTYLAGRNPGVFSEFAKYAAVGKTFVMYDTAGRRKEFRLTRLMQTPISTRVGGVSEEIRWYLYLHMEDHEGIVIQYCRSDLDQLQLWIAEPV